MNTIKLTCTTPVRPARKTLIRSDLIPQKLLGLILIGCGLAFWGISGDLGALIGLSPFYLSLLLSSRNALK